MAPRTRRSFIGSIFPWPAWLLWPGSSRSATSSWPGLGEALPYGDNRYAQALNVESGGAPVPPKPPAYAKPASHAIYYYQGSITSEMMDRVARFTSATLGSAFNAEVIDGKTRCGNIARALMARNPTMELYNYMSPSEQNMMGFDYGGFQYSGPYRHAGGKLFAANWLLKTWEGHFHETYGSGATTAVQNRGVWAAGVLYEVNDCVQVGSTYYRCSSRHTSSAVFATDQIDRWSPDVSAYFLPDRGAWAPATAYKVRDVVTQAGQYYKCTAAHTSPGSFSTGSGWTSTMNLLAVNYPQNGLPDHDGESWARYFAKYVHAIHTRDMAGGWKWSGAYLDSGIGYPDPSVPMDWLNTKTGNQVPEDTAAVKRGMESFATEFVGELKAVFGADYKIIGNPNSGALGTEFLATQGKGVELCDGCLHEGGVMPSVSWSSICIDGISGGVNSVMESGWVMRTTYVKDVNNSRTTMGVKGLTSNDYRAFRLGLGVALMRDGRVSPSAALELDYVAAMPPWIDEFDQPIGVGIDARQALPFKGQIFKRRFENGVVLINQSKSLNLNLPGNARLNKGVWASGVNYGQYDHVTFNDGTNRRYICNYGQAHLSGTFATDLAAGRWHMMTNTAIPNFTGGADCSH